MNIFSYKNMLHFFYQSSVQKNNDWTKWWIFTWYPGVRFISYMGREYLSSYMTSVMTSDMTLLSGDDKQEINE